MPRKFAAQYAGRCVACPDPIEIGDDLIHDEDDVVHYDCAGQRPTLKPREVCPRCFIEKATNGECGCDP